MLKQHCDNCSKPIDTDPLESLINKFTVEDQSSKISIKIMTGKKEFRDKNLSSMQWYSPIFCIKCIQEELDKLQKYLDTYLIKHNYDQT